jgi:hypothetical protein
VKFVRKLENIHRTFSPLQWFILAIYIAALFPSRNHWDTVEILRLARSGDSLDQWTALYFRFLSLLSFNGNYAFVPAIVGLLGLAFSTRYFIHSLRVSEKARNLALNIIIATPFVGVFGMTLTHEVQTVTGALLLTGNIMRRQDKSGDKPNRILISVAYIYCLMTYVGVFIVMAFLIAIITRDNRAKVLPLIPFTFGAVLFSSAILHVERVNPATNLQGVLGDVKCVTQHPDSVITKTQWLLLEEFAPIEKWREPLTCSDASKTLFVAAKFPGKESQILKLWLELARENPQIVLQARIQRSAMALPPPFFQSQPNFSSRNYLEPVGQNTQDDLQQWSPLFKTSNDDHYQKEHFSQPSFLKPLEYLVLLPAFILNSQSWFWGWGGMWFVIFFLLLITRTRFSYKDIFRISLPHMFTIIGLFVGSPISDPRYAMTLTMTGFITSVVFLVEYLARRKPLPN